MPEGPSIVLLKELVQGFTGKKVIQVSGKNSEIDLHAFENKNILAFKSWGKHFLICFSDLTIRIHFMMLGTYSINKKKPIKSALSLTFAQGSLHFYTCQIKVLKENPDTIYNWATDIMSPEWNVSTVKKNIQRHAHRMICDVLLDQDIFSGVGNIIKNEALFRSKIHPKSITGHIPKDRMDVLLQETRNYSFDFLKWRRINELSKHWEAYQQKICSRCLIPLIRKKIGAGSRICFYCEQCQVNYQEPFTQSLFTSA